MAVEECGNRTLRGDYGILVSGIRGAGPGMTESFIGTALRTYDGHGQFTPGRQLARFGHRSSDGTCRQPGRTTVNPDCSGTSMIFFPGAPFPVETAFVIVDQGEEVKDIVMAPQPNLVTAVLTPGWSGEILLREASGRADRLPRPGLAARRSWFETVPEFDTQRMPCASGGAFCSRRLRACRPYASRAPPGPAPRSPCGVTRTGS